MNDDERRLITEIHESAHAVIGWAQGRRIATIVVRPGAGGHTAGFVEFEPIAGVSPLEFDIIDLTTIEAGRLAEDMIFPEPSVRPTDETGYAAAAERLIQVLPDQVREHVQYALSPDRPGDDDEDAIARVASEFAPDEAIWLMALCRARAKRLITEYRAAILALVVELSRRPILGGPAAEAIIEAHGRST